MVNKKVLCYNNHWNVTEIQISKLTSSQNWALHGFGFAEMPPIILGGKCNSQAPCAEGI